MREHCFQLSTKRYALFESFQHLFHGGFHAGRPSRASPFNRFALAGFLQHDFGFSSVANGQNGSQEERLFGVCVGDARFLFAECELEVIVEKGFHQFLDLLCCGVTSAQTDEPIIGISQVFHPAKCGIVDHFRGGRSGLFHDRSKRFGFCCSPPYQSVFLTDESNIFRIVPFSGPFFVCFLHFLDIFVEFVQVDIRQDRADDAALGGTNEAFLFASVEVHISCL